MVSAGAVAEMLDIVPQDCGRLSRLDLANEVAKGLPLSALDHVVRSVAPQDRAFAFRLVPRATLARRRAAGTNLSANEGAKVARLAEVWTFARDVLGERRGGTAFPGPSTPPARRSHSLGRCDGERTRATAR